MRRFDRNIVVYAQEALGYLLLGRTVRRRQQQGFPSFPHRRMETAVHLYVEADSSRRAGGGAADTRYVELTLGGWQAPCLRATAR